MPFKYSFRGLRNHSRQLKLLICIKNGLTHAETPQFPSFTLLSQVHCIASQAPMFSLRMNIILFSVFNELNKALK